MIKLDRNEVNAIECHENCLQIRRLLWFGHLVRMEESLWCVKSQKFEIGGNLTRRGSKKISSEVIKRDPEKKKVRTMIAAARNVLK